MMKKVIATTMSIFICVSPYAGGYEDAKNKRYRFDWKMKERNVIDQNSVCRQYTKGTLQRRFCREQAKDYFSKQCDKSKGDDKIKYCFAATLHPAR